MTTALVPPSVTPAPPRSDGGGARMPRIDEAAVRERLARRDEQAFAELVETFSEPLRAAARRILPVEQDAEDALQDAWISAWTHLDGFGGQSRLSTWLYRITVNAALMRRRAMRRRPAVSLEQAFSRRDGEGAPPPQPPADQPPVDARARGAERRDHILRALDQLPGKYRDVVELRDLRELDTRQTAERLGMGEAAIKTRLHRARRALAGILSPDLAGLPDGARAA